MKCGYCKGRVVELTHYCPICKVRMCFTCFGIHAENSPLHNVEKIKGQNVTEK